MPSMDIFLWVPALNNSIAYSTRLRFLYSGYEMFNSLLKQTETRECGIFRSLDKV
jgi:hypothetical protein